MAAIDALIPVIGFYLARRLDGHWPSQNRLVILSMLEPYKKELMLLSSPDRIRLAVNSLFSNQ